MGWSSARSLPASGNSAQRLGYDPDAIRPGWPEQEWRISTLAVPFGKVAAVRLFGSDHPVVWSQDATALHVTAPAAGPCQHANVLEVETER